jgi:hypothetical protein
LSANKSVDHAISLPLASEKNYKLEKIKLMKTIITLSICLLVTIQDVKAQNDSNMNTLPYAEIPAYPESYSAPNVMARMIDGLGYRYYWATDGLTSEDLNYKVSESSRTSLATIEHIHGLVNTSLKTIKSEPIIKTDDKPILTFKMIRSETLLNLKEASDLLRSGVIQDLGTLKLTFKRGEKTSEFEFWHLINGPVADALWHVGQVVSMRRASGNPLDPTVNVFSGKNRTN